MCTQFILALIYFLILIIINFLLSKLIITYQKNFSFQIKLKTILNFFDIKKLTLLLFLEKNKTKEPKFFSKLTNLKNFSKTKDILIIGNIYNSIIQKKKTKSDFFFLLLEQQYFSKN